MIGWALLEIIESVGLWAGARYLGMEHIGFIYRQCEEEETVSVNESASQVLHNVQTCFRFTVKNTQIHVEESFLKTQ